MTRSRPVGLYNIGLRGLDVTEVLTVCAEHQVPFVHLRGGPRGYDLAGQDRATLSRWARHAQRSAPVALVTADLDLAQFCQPGSEGYRHACTELGRVAEATAILGAPAIRLMGRHPPGGPDGGRVIIPDLRHRYGIVTLVEPHDPRWFTPAALTSLESVLHANPGLGLLLDSGQVHRAWCCLGTLHAPVLDGLVRHARVVHWSDSGHGLDGAGHRLLAVATRARAGDGVQFGFEWTGPDRSTTTCLARYQSAVSWWQTTQTEQPS
ncbi:MAG: hypothetical protein ACRDRW_13250 [Pseudonocardiaceae bacterium]